MGKPTEMLHQLQGEPHCRCSSTSLERSGPGEVEMKSLVFLKKERKEEEKQKEKGDLKMV